MRVADVQDKIVIHFKATGGTKVLKNPKVKVSKTDKFSKLADHVSKALQNPPSLFLYVREAYMPSLDEQLDVLYAAHATDKELVVHYSENLAWGPFRVQDTSSTAV